ncbi:UNVERIFIED_CONTAM: hypothetical protein HDU68_003755 [Siphonaria sp. JEL0065]|nr:hypothetical protein HDU68_003755 [Siphonaria sp. JEL0065]
MLVSVFSVALATQAVLAYAPVVHEGNRTESLYNGPLTYGGGRLLPNAKIFPVFVGNARNPAGVNAFYASIGSSAHYGMLTQYNKGSYVFGPAQFVKSFTGSVSGGSDPAAVVKTLLDSGVLASIPADAYFPVHYGPEYDSSVASSCSQYCAYHDSFSYKGQKVAYGMMPDCSATTCHNGYPGPTQFDSMTCIAAHELLEAVTDPDPTSGWNGNGEIGDICYGKCGGVVGGDGATINVQYEWSNVENKCILNPANVPSQTTTTTTKSSATTTTTTKSSVTTTTTTTKVQTGTFKTTTTTTTKVPLTTGSAGGNSAGAKCATYGAWACNNSLICSYGTGNALVWVQVGSVSSC